MLISGSMSKSYAKMFIASSNVNYAMIFTCDESSLDTIIFILKSPCSMGSVLSSSSSVNLNDNNVV